MHTHRRRTLIVCLSVCLSVSLSEFISLLLLNRQPAAEDESRLSLARILPETFFSFPYGQLRITLRTKQACAAACCCWAQHARGGYSALPNHHHRPRPPCHLLPY
ncbi:hypothetical protein B0T24DRAFT_629343, partial [Lasiosphaeria ovina]